MANISNEWNQSINDINNAQKEAEFAESQRTYDGYRSLVEQDRMARAQRKRAADNALASMLIEARNSGNGMVPASMCAAVSQDCGMDIAGGVLTKDGNFHLLTHDANGGIVEFPNGSGVINPGNQFGVLQRTGLGKDLQKELFNGFLKKFTESQLAKVGIKRPVDTLKRKGVVEVGGTTDGKAMSALAGRVPSNRSRISVFASDGQGGATRTEYDGFTGERSEENLGTRSPDSKVRWKQVSVGPSDTFDGKDDKTQVREYENSQTGERVRVKDGDMPPWEKSAMSDKERIAQINNESRERVGEQAIKRANISADATKYKADKGLEGKKASAPVEGGGVKFDKNIYEALKSRLDALKYEEGAGGVKTPRTMSESEKKKAEQIEKRMDDMLMGASDVETSGGETSGDGGTEPPKSDNLTDGEKKRIMEFKVGTPFTLHGKKCVRTDDEVGFKFQQ